jgi:hypothetical protein
LRPRQREALSLRCSSASTTMPAEPPPVSLPLPVFPASKRTDTLPTQKWFFP